MAAHHTLQGPPEAQGASEPHLASLQRSFSAEQDATLAKQAADKAWSPVAYLGTLLAGAASYPHLFICEGDGRIMQYMVVRSLRC